MIIKTTKGKIKRNVWTFLLKLNWSNLKEMIVEIKHSLPNKSMNALNRVVMFCLHMIEWTGESCHKIKNLKAVWKKTSIE